jgi:hypothetical protein
VIWAPCQSCSAKNRCEVFRAMQIFGPDGLPGTEHKEIRSRSRQRLLKRCKLSIFVAKRTLRFVSCAPLSFTSSSGSTSAWTIMAAPISLCYPIGTAPSPRIRPDG